MYKLVSKIAQFSFTLVISSDKINAMKNSESIASYLRELYVHDSLVANLRVLQLIKQNFPGTHATQKTVYAWKTMLRREGVAIPMQRSYEKK